MAVLANTLPAMVTGTDGREWDKKVVALGLKGLQALIAAGCNVDVPAAMRVDMAATEAGAMVGPGVLGAAAEAAVYRARLRRRGGGGGGRQRR